MKLPVRTAIAAKTTLKDLRGLKALKLEIEIKKRLAAEQLAAKLAAARQLKAEKELFAHSIGPIKALPARHGPGQKAQISLPQPEPIPVQLLLDEQAVMREALSDEFDGDALLDTDEALSFRRPGIGVDVVRKLRRGAWRIQGQLDLHGLRRADARAKPGNASWP